MPTICFDLDGTLSDPRVGITRSIQYALEELTGEAPPEEELLWCIGPPIQHSFETLLAGRADPWDAVAKYRERFGAVGKFENTLYPGIPEMLEALKATGQRLFVATSKPTIYARQIVEHFGLTAFFEDVCGAELDGRLSDKSELLAWLLADKRVAADDATMVGDRRHDIVGARNNGLRAIGVLYGYGSEAELLEAGAEAVCASPEELTGVLSSVG